MIKKKNLKYLFLLLALLLGVYLVIYFFLPWQNQKKMENLARKKNMQWEEHLEHARLQTYLKHYEEALSEYRQLLEIQPDNSEVKVDLATILYYQKKYPQSLELLQSIPLDRRNSKVLILQANLELANKNFSEAESLYRQYLKENPNDRLASLKLAEVLSWQKKYEEATPLYEQLLAQDPQNIQIRREYAKVLIWMGKFEKGSEELKKTLAEENPFPVNNEKRK